MTHLHRRLLVLRRGTAWLGALLLIGTLVLVGCTGTQEARSDEEGAADSARAARAPKGPELADVSPSIRTIQLYRGANERQLPVLSLRGSGGRLTLEFDLMEAAGRPLSVYFYHTDRTWRRDLSPSEYMDSFQNDNLLDYSPSRGTEVAYTHYVYRFPNDNIRFRVSGNYVLRVTEQGRPDDVLFERPFFVSEDAGPLALRVDDVPVSGQRLPSDRPAALFTPPPELQGSPFQYETCFVRNGRLDTARCTNRPRLVQQPALEFDLYHDEAFVPTTADYFLDLSALRSGGQIAHVDRTGTPFRVELEAAYAQFPGNAGAPPLDGQVVVDGAVRDVGEPDVEAEYVTARFSFVPPDEQPMARPVTLHGSFGETARMEWVPARGRYEGNVLLKQGLYEYHYRSNDPALREVLRRALPPARGRYTAFVYYTDWSMNTDRLLAVQTVEAR